VSLPTSPLSTRRLRPLRQQTKHGVFQLLDSGYIWVDFMPDPSLTLIAPDGLQVRCYAKDRVSPGEAVRGTVAPLETHAFPNLPPAKRKIYEYARRFVALMRSKTPRVIISTPRFRAFLMDTEDRQEERDNPDLLLRYHAECGGSEANWRLEYQAGTRTARILDASGSFQTSLVLGEPAQACLADDRLTSRTRAILSDFLGRYEQACTTAKRIRADQDADRLPFPFVVRESGDMATSARPVEGNTKPLVVSTQTAYCQPTVPLLTLHDAMRDYDSQPQMVPSPPAIPHPTGLTFAIAYKTFLPQVGWCLASTDDQYLMLFLDGACLLLDGRTSSLRYQDGSRAPCDLRMEPSQPGGLPDYVKHRLAHFPRFVQLLKQAGSR